MGSRTQWCALCAPVLSYSIYPLNIVLSSILAEFCVSKSTVSERKRERRQNQRRRRSAQQRRYLNKLMHYMCLIWAILLISLVYIVFPRWLLYFNKSTATEFFALFCFWTHCDVSQESGVGSCEASMRTSKSSEDGWAVWERRVEEGALFCWRRCSIDFWSGRGKDAKMNAGAWHIRGAFRTNRRTLCARYEPVLMNYCIYSIFFLFAALLLMWYKAQRGLNKKHYPSPLSFVFQQKAVLRIGSKEKRQANQLIRNRS